MKVKTDKTTSEDISCVSVNMGRDICQSVAHICINNGFGSYWYHVTGPSLRDLNFYGVPDTPMFDQLSSDIYSLKLL